MAARLANIHQMHQEHSPDAYTALCDHRRVGPLRRLLGAPTPEERARLAEAASAVDRELAANIELASMWDQTHQAVVFENAEFSRHAGAIGAGAPDVFEALTQAYARMPDAESAMERRGPANTIRPDDLALVETWEGDVRSAQRDLRAAANAPEPSLWSLFMERLRRRKRASVR